MRFLSDKKRTRDCAKVAGYPGIRWGDRCDSCHAIYIVLIHSLVIDLSTSLNHCLLLTSPRPATDISSNRPPLLPIHANLLSTQTNTRSQDENELYNFEGSVSTVGDCTWCLLHVSGEKVLGSFGRRCRWQC